MTRRRAFLVGLACCLYAIGIGSTLAQDPRGTIAQKRGAHLARFDRSWGRPRELGRWRVIGYFIR